MRSLQDHFLIAMPAMADPNFTETVTYHLQARCRGSVRHRHQPPERSVARRDARSARHRAHGPQPGRDSRWCTADPSNRERGFVLHRSSAAFEATLATGSDMKLTSSPDILAALGRGAGPRTRAGRARLRRLGPRSARGRARAATRGSPCPANPAIIFDTPFEQRWTAALGPARRRHSTTSRTMPATRERTGKPAWRRLATAHILRRVRLRTASHRRRHREPRDAHRLAADDAAPWTASRPGPTSTASSRIGVPHNSSWVCRRATAPKRSRAGRARSRRP